MAAQELAEVAFIDTVKLGGERKAMWTAQGAKPGQRASFEAGIVTIRDGERTVLVPVVNVAWMLAKAESAAQTFVPPKEPAKR